VPIVIGLTVIGFFFGVSARAAGLTWAETGLMSALVYAGPSQFVAIGLLEQGAVLSSIVLTTFIVNLRYVLYATSLGQHYRDRSVGWLSLIGFGLVDAAYALSIADCIKNPNHPRKDLYYLGATLLIFVTWIPASMVGSVLITALPELAGLGLEFINPAVYIAILVPLMKGWTEIVTAILAIPALLTTSSYLPHIHAVLVSMILIILAGGFLNWSRRQSSS
jgi:4-azaleucine resistance transporter AzlC